MTPVRYVVLVSSNSDFEKAAWEDPEKWAAFAKFNHEYIESGLIISANGFIPSSMKSARISFEDGQTTVQNGPLEIQGQVHSYYILNTDSLDTAVEFARKMPLDKGYVDIRKILDAGDLPDVVPEAHKIALQKWQDSHP